MAPIILLRRHRKAVSPVECALCRNFSIQGIVHPTHGSSSHDRAAPDHPHALRLPEAPNKEPSVATRFRKPSTGMHQISTLGLPGAFSSNCWRRRRDTSLSVPVFFEIFAPWVPFLQTLWDLVADFPPWWTMVQPRHFFLSDQPMSYSSFLRPTSFHDQLPHHMSVNVCPRSVGFFFAAQPGFAPAKLLLSTPHTRVWLPTSSSRPTILVCFKSIFFTY